MDALLCFCQSGTGGLILVLLAGVLILLFEVMVVTTAIHWVVRFVKKAWD